MAESGEESFCVLLVEDNEDHADLIIRGLHSLQGIGDIRHVSDGEMALDYLFRRGKYSDPDTSPRPHLILLDLRIPRIDGLEVLKTIKTHSDLLRIPVVILTSSDAETDITTSYDYHANSYVIKPLNFKIFMTLLRDLGSYWFQLNRTMKRSDPENTLPGGPGR